METERQGDRARELPIDIFDCVVTGNVCFGIYGIIEVLQSYSV